MRARLRAFKKSTLLMNATYLMLSTLVIAASGFLFWLVVTNTYDTAAVGVATTLLSVSSLLSLLSLAGLDAALVRFLPAADNKNAYINSGFVVVAIVSAVLAACLGLALPLVSPGLAVLDSTGAFISFVFFTAVTALNVLTNAVFLAFKEAEYILIINTIFGAGKVLIALFVAPGNAMTIFGIAGVAQLIGLALSIMWIRRRFGYIFLPRLHAGALRAVRKFSVWVYASSVLNLLPPTLLPLIIVHRMGAESAAYYYMAFTIAGVLYTIAYASMQSVFAEGSHNEAAIHVYVAKAVKAILALLLPASLLTIAASHLLLAAFGQEYARNAATLLQLFALGALPVAVYSVLGAVFKVTKCLQGILGMNAVYAASILGLSYILVPRIGLIGVGWAWIIGNIVAAGVGVLFIVGRMPRRSPNNRNLV